MTIDADKVYDKLEVLAVEQGKIQTKQAADATVNAEDHKVLREHITNVRDYQVKQNGNMEELREDFEIVRQTKKIEDASVKAVDELVNKWGKRVIGVILFGVGAIPALFLILDRML